MQAVSIPLTVPVMAPHKNYHWHVIILDATDFTGVMVFGGFGVMKLTYFQLAFVSISLWQVNKTGAGAAAMEWNVQLKQ